MACHIVLADDHALLRKGLRKILEGKVDYRVIGEAGDGLELLSLLKELAPDVIILDISMPKLGGIEAITEIKAIRPSGKIVILTMHNEKEYLHQAFSAGADGYILKEDADTELFSAIASVRQGKKYVSPSMAYAWMKDWAEMRHGESISLPEPEPLTVREKEVLKLIAEEKSSKEIAELLHISARTVDHHRANLMAKLNLKNTVALIKYAVKKGYV
jgi:DNA-binding NarL/FixJ family response regulator